MNDFSKNNCIFKRILWFEYPMTWDSLCRLQPTLMMRSLLAMKKWNCFSCCCWNALEHPGAAHDDAIEATLVLKLNNSTSDRKLSSNWLRELLACHCTNQGNGCNETQSVGFSNRLLWSFHSIATPKFFHSFDLLFIAPHS